MDIIISPEGENTFPCRKTKRINLNLNRIGN